MRRLLSLPLGLALLAAGCSNATFEAGAQPTPTLVQPPASAFHPGACTDVSTAVLQVGRDAVALGDGPTPSGVVRDSLETAQAQIDRTAKGAGFTPAEKGPLEALVVSIGLVRLRADGNTYSADLGTQLSAAYDAAVAACTS